MEQTLANHPSRWSPAVLDAITPVLTRWQYPVHDPFAGTGERLGKLCDNLGLTFTGTEIEPEFIIDPRVKPGNSRLPDSYPAGPYCIVTSPVYPNGMTDHFKPQDSSRRVTYRQALASITGEDRPLHTDNMGQYGPRRGAIAEAKHWTIAKEAVRWWPSRVVVNASDFILDHKPYQVVNRWRDILHHLGYRTRVVSVVTSRMRFGANREARAEYEAVIEAVWLHRLETQI